MSKDKDRIVYRDGNSWVNTPQQKPKILSYAEGVCRAFDLLPRQVEYLFRIYSQFMAVSHNKDEYMDSWLQAPLILIAMLIKDRQDIYEKIGKSKLRPNELVSYMDTLNFSGPRGSDNRRSIILHSLAFNLTENNKSYNDEAAQIIRDRFMQNMSPDISPLASLASMVDRFRSFPSEESIFQKFYKRIEEWRGYLD